MDLLQKMVAGSPQFVRCIKPNDLRAPKSLEPAKVLKQLRYTGVLETIRIRQHGFSHRFTFADFFTQYRMLAFGFNENVVTNRENSRLLLIRLKMDGWALGKSKVFLKYYHVEYLAKLYEEQVHKVVLVQACIRRWLAQVFYRKYKKRISQSALILQRHVRGWLTRRRYGRLKEIKEQPKDDHVKNQRDKRESQNNEKLSK